MTDCSLRAVAGLSFRFVRTSQKARPAQYLSYITSNCLLLSLISLFTICSNNKQQLSSLHNPQCQCIVYNRARMTSLDMKPILVDFHLQQLRLKQSLPWQIPRCKSLLQNIRPQKNAVLKFVSMEELLSKKRFTKTTTLLRNSSAPGSERMTSPR
jgi:hypothetical protein